MKILNYQENNLFLDNILNMPNLFSFMNKYVLNLTK